MLRHAARSLFSPKQHCHHIPPSPPLRTSRPEVSMSRPYAVMLPRAMHGGGGTAVSDGLSSPASMQRGPAFIRKYLQLIEKRPISTKSITAASIFLLADATSQGIIILQSHESQQPMWDFGRTVRMVAAGLFLSGPSLHLWFNLMSAKFPKRDILSTLKKMALGQAIYGPIFNTVFFSVNAYLQGESTQDVAARLKRDLLPTFKNGLVYWPFCDFLTYRYIPVHLQPLMSNSFAYLWTVYLTYMASLKKAGHFDR